jgi:hypothetical protein
VASTLARAAPLGAEMPGSVVKAEYVVRFPRFVDWPSDVVPTGDDPFVVCEIGQSQLGARLETIVTERRIKDRRAVLRRPPLEQLDECHIVVIAPSEQPELPRILERTAARPILTVGDGQGLAERGVLIGLYDEPPFVRFEINARAAQASGLKFSSQLLRLGRIVGDAP